MFFWTLQITIMSVIFILLVHHLFLFFKTTLTVPKIKDMVNAPNHKYEQIYNTIASSSKPDFLAPIEDTLSPKASSTKESMKESMKDELKHFLKQSGNKGIVSSNEVSSSYTNF